MIKLILVILVFLLWFAGLLPCNLQAAEGPEGTSREVGVLEKEMREREERKRFEEIRLPEIESKLPEQEEIEGPDAEFLVSAIEVAGNSVFSREAIKALVESHQNQSLTLKKIKSIAKEITSYYRARGYVTTRAVIPPQKIDAGKVTIQIYEGKIGNIKIEGLRYSRESLIRRRFQIKPNDVLRYQILEGVLANLNTNPDRKVRVVLLPGEKPETTDIVLKIEEKFPVHAMYGFNNLGTVSTGRFRQSSTLAFTNLLGFDDQLTSRVEVAERGDFVGWANSYLLPVGSRGDLVSFDMNQVNVIIGKDLKALNAVGRALVFGPTAIIPFLRSQRIAGEWTMGFDYKRIRTLLSGVTVSKDDLRVFRMGPNFIENDRWGRTIFTNEIQLAFAGFMGGLGHNDPNASRREADGYFWQYNVSLGRIQNIWRGIQAVGKMSAQFSPHRLVAAQQMRLGGYDSVRGYPEGDYLADYGYQGSLEFRVPPYFIPKEWKWPFANIPVIDSVRGVCFLDFGKGFLNSPFMEEEKSERLTGAGAGLRVSISRNVQARVDWGVPLAGKTGEGKGTRLHVSIQIGY